VDYGTSNAIDSSVVERICLVDGVDKFLDVGTEGSDLRTLARFVCKYAIHTCTIKDDLKARLQSAQNEVGESEGENLWDCVADFLTNSDLAFAVWQYINSASDWKEKRECEDSRLRYTCNSRWTSDKSSWRYVRGGTDEASSAYDKLVTFFRDLKNHREYGFFKYSCNDVAKQVGLVPPLTKNPANPEDSRSAKRRRQEAERGVSAMNFGELFEAVPGMAGYDIERDDMRQAPV
jgi:hypothetical protein